MTLRHIFFWFFPMVADDESRPDPPADAGRNHIEQHVRRRLEASLLTLTGLAISAEIAIFCRCLTVSLPPAETALSLGIFHCGYLISSPMAQRIHSRSVVIITGVGLAMVSIAGSALTSSWTHVTLLALSGLVFSGAVQAARRALKAWVKLPSQRKNKVKAAGMVAGGLVGADRISILLLAFPALMLTFEALRQRPIAVRQQAPERPGRRPRPLLWGELLHHAHYFAYCYTFWYLTPRFIGPQIGVLFLIGWLGYFVAERVITERRKIFSQGSLALGHLVVAGALTVLPFSPAPIVLALWLATGIGGGTAYMLGNVEPAGSREVFEDSGHVLGALAAAIAAAVFPQTQGHGAAATVWLGASLSLAAALTFWWTGRTRHNNEARLYQCE